jgi:hypothetical protein
LDYRDDALGVRQYVVIPKSEHTVAMASELLGPLLVGQRINAVLATVDFNNQLAGWAGKIGDKWADRMLSSEP